MSRWIALLLPFIATCSNISTVYGFLFRSASYGRSALAAVPVERRETDLCCHQQRQSNSTAELARRELLPRLFGVNVLAVSSAIIPPFLVGSGSKAALGVTGSKKKDYYYLKSVTDPNTYPALVYSNPKSASNNQDKKIPLLVVLHGAGKNDETVWSLADPKGEHAGLLPSLIACDTAPETATDNFAVVAPYAAGKQSFYEEPRSKLLRFVEWVCSEQGQEAGCPANIDPARVFLFGFSDGATVAVELATTRRFKACIICAYGFSGVLPKLALERLKDVPMWIFHSADDVIFPVAYSDQLVTSLRSVTTSSLVLYTRYDTDQEGFTGRVRGHSVGITASKLADIYTWMLSIP
ncbi:phospholipase Carboxylesterase [Seminavis robusta]|uniref:Phospholipase Carboxylesterase n=1 Tax=Seminavis robusta TaxID=568900 RepID=A0A9N8D7K1_9STRA|nr:phospholipase Carboxylesterase [Seminavis robusta]|eukprot:Sro27_g018110.1 phospholipase Carboxylesterase (352) ;mRNA; r:42327-43382